MLPPEGPRERDLSIGGLTLHTEAFGAPEAPACLLVAGALCPGDYWSDHFCHTLAAAGFFVLRYDQRDTGFSSVLEWEKTPYTLADLACDAKGILDAYGIAKAHLIGHSMGGYVCQQLALDTPERVLQLVLISTHPIGATATSRRVTEAEVEELQKTFCLVPGKTREETIENYLSYWRLMHGTYPMDEERARKFTEGVLARSQNQNHALLIRELLLSLEARRHLVQGIKAPLCVIHGGQDLLIPPQEGHAFLEELPEAEYLLIPEMGHVFFHPLLEDQLVALLVKFISR